MKCPARGTYRRAAPRSIARPADLDVVRASYDWVADTYASTGGGRQDAHPWLRAGPDAFAESVRGEGPVLDVGCGPGHVTAYLADRGLDASGVDLPPGDLDDAPVAARAWPRCSPTPRWSRCPS